MFKTSLCVSEVQLELNALINMLFVLYLTCVRVNQGFLRADAAQHGDPTVVQAELRASLGLALERACPRALLPEWSPGAPQTDMLMHAHTLRRLYKHTWGLTYACTRNTHVRL